MLKDYFHFYLNNTYGAVPEWLYIFLLSVLGFSTILSFTIFGARKGLRVLSLAVLLEIVFLILCGTVFLRETDENVGCNFIPFWSYMMFSKDLQYSMYMENLMNVLMFIPFGFILGWAFKNLGRKKMIVVALRFSVTIEVLQFVFKKGFAEVDDVIHNVLGGIIGYGIYKLMRFGYEKISKRRVAVL